MKKITAIVAFSLLVSAQAFAADSVTLSLTTTGKSVYGNTGAAATNANTLLGKTSTGVSFGGKSGAAGYATVTQHKSGSRAFGTAFDSTSVYYKDVTVGTTTGSIVTPSATDKSIFSAWTSM